MSSSMSVSSVSNLIKKKVRTEHERKILETLFKEGDKNHDQCISPQEYTALLKKKGINVTEEEVAEVFAAADKNQDQ